MNLKAHFYLLTTNTGFLHFLTTFSDTDPSSISSTLLFPWEPMIIIDISSFCSAFNISFSGTPNSILDVILIPQSLNLFLISANSLRRDNYSANPFHQLHEALIALLLHFLSIALCILWRFLIRLKSLLGIGFF